MKANRLGGIVLSSIVVATVLSSSLFAGGGTGQDNAPGFVDKFVWITALSDSPDPFSASAKGTCVIKTSYRVRVHPGDTSDGKSPQTTFTRWLRQSVTITNQSGQVIRKLEAVKQLPEPEGKATGLETQDMDVATGWDGRTQAGSMAPDGLYRYAVVGTYFRRAQTPGNVQEHVFGITSEKTGEITLDNTPPTISATQDPAANAAGWNNTDLKVTFSAQDNLSGIAEVTQPVTVTEEGKDIGVRGQAKDNAGNVAELTYKVSIDKTPPALTAAQEPAPDENGWNQTDVMVTFGAEDRLSGVAELTAPVAVTQEGEDIEVPGSATDNAGNTSQIMPTVSIDKTPPETAVSRSVEPNKYGWNNTDVELTFQPTDAFSGVAHTYAKVDDAEAVDETEVTLSAEGEHTVAYWSVDEAGNAEAEKTVSVNIDKTPPGKITPDMLTFPCAECARVEDGKIVTEKSAITFRAPIDADVVQAIAFADNPALTVTAVIESVRVDVSGLSPGDYVVTVRLIDKADNKSDSPLPVKNVAQTGPVDTDGDGIPDEVEIAWGLDPNDPSDANEDADGDCLTNLQEYRDTHTDPNNPDTDGDGMSDGCDEYNHGLDPLDPTGVNGPDGDLDEDGCTNAFELEIGTQPNDAGSGLAAGSVIIRYLCDTSQYGSEAELEIESTHEGWTKKHGTPLPSSLPIRDPYRAAKDGVGIALYYPASLRGAILMDGPSREQLPVDFAFSTNSTLQGYKARCTGGGRVYLAGEEVKVVGGAAFYVKEEELGKYRRIEINNGRCVCMPPTSPTASVGVVDATWDGNKTMEVYLEGPERARQFTMGVRCETLWTDIDMELEPLCRTFGEDPRQEAPANILDVLAGEKITVKATLSKANGFNAEEANRTVVINYPHSCFSCDKDDYQTHSSNDPFVWVLTRNDTPLPQIAFVKTWVQDLMFGDPEFGSINPVSFGTDAGGQPIEVRPEGEAGAGETTWIMPLERGSWHNIASESPIPRCPDGTCGTVLFRKVDDCGNRLTLECTSGCYYEYKYNNTVVGRCVYVEGINKFLYIMDKRNKVFMATLLFNVEPGLGQGTTGVKDWSVWYYDCVADSGTCSPLCRECAPGQTFDDAALEKDPLGYGIPSRCESL